MTPLIRDLNTSYNPDLMVAVADKCTFNDTLYREGILETNTELHAGECETSQMLAIAPETVHMDRAVDWVSSTPRPFLNYGSIFRCCPDGVWGQATLANAAKGEKILSRSTELAVDALNKAFDFMAAKGKYNYTYF